jgi:hypothetical protein
MKIFKTIDKVLAGFGNIRAMERNHVDTYTENRIESIEGEKIAESQYGELWISFQELGGYHFLNTTILSRINIKTLKGGTLKFLGNNMEFILDTDNTQLESDFSNVSSRWISNINYGLTEKDIDFIQKKEYSKLCFQFKKKSLEFNVIN